MLPSLLVLGLMSSCINYKRIELLQEKSLEGTTEFINQRGASYRIKAGDHLYIKIYSLDPKTSKFFQSDFPALMNATYVYLNSYKVDNEGYLSFSFIDRIFVKGLAIDEAQEAIQNTVNQYFKDATVFLKLVNFEIAVLGEVGNPGNYTISKEELNILQALAMAGGMTDHSKRTEVLLIRQTINGSQTHLLDLTDNAILQSEFFLSDARRCAVRAHQDLQTVLVWVLPLWHVVFAFKLRVVGFVVVRCNTS
ncbi:MAG: hypothetical protein HC896_05515 [Bacteroidales bacterium]|nr:hypothetical protein [Bacteroidales bacterium]